MYMYMYQKIHEKVRAAANGAGGKVTCNYISLRQRLFFDDNHQVQIGQMLLADDAPGGAARNVGVN